MCDGLFMATDDVAQTSCKFTRKVKMNEVKVKPSSTESLKINDKASSNYLYVSRSETALNSSDRGEASDKNDYNSKGPITNSDLYRFLDNELPEVVEAYKLDESYSLTRITGNNAGSYEKVRLLHKIQHQRNRGPSGNVGFTSILISIRSFIFDKNS